MELDNLFQAQRQLSEKDLIIYNAELQKKSKSVGLAYFLLICFGWLGLHKFYLEKIREGIAYLIVGPIYFIFIQIFIFNVVFNVDRYWEPTAFVIIFFGTCNVFLIYDLFTLSQQVSKHDKKIRLDLLAQFGIFFNNDEDDTIVPDDFEIFNEDEIVTYEDNDFIDNNDGTVTNKLTGLMWQRYSVGHTLDGKIFNDEAEKLNWYEAMKLNSDFAGYNNWRLPTKKELLTLALSFDNKNKKDSHIGHTKKHILNQIFFPSEVYLFKNKVYTYWSSSPCKDDGSSAWSVDFSNGNTCAYFKEDCLYIRLVR
jgi:TM2 domain-containing membrane protein YozV